MSETTQLWKPSSWIYMHPCYNYHESDGARKVTTSWTQDDPSGPTFEEKLMIPFRLLNRWSILDSWASADIKRRAPWFTEDINESGHLFQKLFRCWRSLEGEKEWDSSKIQAIEMSLFGSDAGDNQLRSRPVPWLFNQVEVPHNIWPYFSNVEQHSAPDILFDKWHSRSIAPRWDLSLWCPSQQKNQPGTALEERVIPSVIQRAKTWLIGSV